MNKINRKNLILATALLVLLVLVVALFVLKIGVGDNGAQYRLLEKLGLYDVQQNFGTGYYSDAFGVSDKSFSKTSYGLMYDIAKQFTEVDGVVGTTLPAVLYLLLIICSAIIFVFSLYNDKSKTMSIAVAVMFLLMFCDSAYTSYLNTPYKNASFFVYILATVALFLYTSKTKKIWSLTAYGIMACLFSNTSTVAALTAIVLGVYSFRIIFINKRYAWKIATSLICCLIIACGVLSLPTDVGNLYNSVFYGAAIENPDAVKELELDEELKAYIQTSYSDNRAQEFVNSPEYEMKFNSKVSIGSILKYYSKSIPEFYSGIKKVANNATSIRTPELPGFVAESGRHGENTGFFTLYSTVKKNVFPAGILSYMVLLIALIVVSIMYIKEYAKSDFQRVVSEFCIVFAICTFVIFPIPYLLNGLDQIVFNMFYFNVMFDISLYMLIISFINVLVAKKNLLKEKYGVNQ